MSSFYPYYAESGRVILDSVLPKTAKVIRTIEAATWLKARLSINDLEFNRVPGQGYF